MASDKLTAAEALAQAECIDRSLDEWERTAPQAVAAMGGRDALAGVSEMTCVGPIPRVDADTWQAMSLEYEERRTNGSLNRGETP